MSKGTKSTRSGCVPNVGELQRVMRERESQL